MQSNDIYLIIFLGSYVNLLFYYLFFINHLKTNPKTETSNNIPLSVVICAKNEEMNLKNFLPSVLEQNYSAFEVVVVIDRSSDGTLNYLTDLQNSYPQLKTISIENRLEEVGKKHALTRGIEISKHDHIVLTDADCFPKSNKWLSNYNSHFNNSDIVLGYGAYQNEKGLLNKLIRFDTFLIASQYMSFASRNMPYMGVGRNMGYKRSLFTEIGFDSHLDLRSGDDDLFVQEAASIGKVSFCLDPEHHTVSLPEKNWKGYWLQKKRHLTTGSRYKLKHKFFLLLFPISIVLFNVSFIYLIWNWAFIPILITIFLIKILIQISILKKISRSLGEKDLVWFSPILEIMTVIYTGLVAMSLLFTKKIEWK